MVITKQQYEDALKRIDEIFNADPDAPDCLAVGRELLDLVMRVEEYEKVHHPIDTSGVTPAIRCEIIDADGIMIAPGVVARTPEQSKPHVGKKGWAEREDDTYRITLDDGTELMGYECWWQPTEDK